MVFLTAFYAVGANGKGCLKPLPLQRYNKKMTYARVGMSFCDFFAHFNLFPLLGIDFGAIG